MKANRRVRDLRRQNQGTSLAYRSDRQGGLVFITTQPHTKNADGRTVPTGVKRVRR